jgi:hypothetical protein
MLEPSKRLHFFVVFYGTLLCLAYALSLTCDNDVKQLLERGHAAAEYGKFLPYGSAATSGVKSYNPGSLMSFFVGVPMMIWDSPFSALFFIFCLHVIAALVMKSALEKEYGAQVAFTSYAVFWCIPWRTLEINLWNPAYMLFFTALHFFSLQRVFYQSRHSFWFSALCSVSIIGAMQFHLSAVILVATTGILFIKGFFRPHWRGLAFGLFLGCLSLVPHFIHRFENPEFYASSDAGGGSSFFAGLKLVYPFFKGVIYWFRHGSFLFPSNAMELTTFSWVSSPELRSFLPILWKILTYIFAAVTLVFSFSATVWLFKKNRNWLGLKRFRSEGVDSLEASSQPKFTEVYGIAMFFSLGLAAAAVPASFSFWHANLVFPIAFVFPILFLNNWLKSQRVMKVIWPTIFIYFGVFTFFSAMESKYHKYPSDLPTKYQELKQELLRSQGGR